MPNAGGRISRSVVETNAQFLMVLSSLHIDADLTKYPRMFVVFNDVSKNPNNQNEKEIYGGATVSDLK